MVVVAMGESECSVVTPGGTDGEEKLISIAKLVPNRLRESFCLFEYSDSAQS